jgi:hypothetical protein
MLTNGKFKKKLSEKTFYYQFFITLPTNSDFSNHRWEKQLAIIEFRKKFYGYKAVSKTRILLSNNGTNIE